MIEWVRRIRGYVCFRVVSSAPEHFLNRAAAEDVELWGVCHTDGGLIACCRAADYRYAAAAARAEKGRLQIIRKYGLPFLWNRARRRPGILVGVAAFFAVQVYLSGFVWQIEVTGNQRLSAQTILQEAEKIGLYEGMRKSEVNVQANRHGLMQAIPELSWVTVNHIGCRMEIQVRETVPQPEVVPNDEPCNLIARAGGVILRVQAEDGFAVVKAGDTVQAGDLLAEGLRTDAYEGTILHHAYGAVYAVTSHQFSVEQPLTYAQTTDTDETIVRRRWRIFGLELPLTLTAAPADGYRRTCRETQIYCLGVPLPMQVYTETWIRQDVRQMVCTEEEALTLARQKITEAVRQQIPEAQILSVDESVQLQGGTLIVTRALTCVEDIAVQVPIELGEQGIQP